MTFTLFIKYYLNLVINSFQIQLVKYLTPVYRSSKLQTITEYKNYKNFSLIGSIVKSARAVSIVWNPVHFITKWDKASTNDNISHKVSKKERET